MKRNLFNRDPQPVEDIELSGSNLFLRIAIMIVLGVVGAVALINGLTGLLSANSGWQQIEVDSALGITCGDEFVLFYNIGAGGLDATPELKQVTKLYSEAALHCWQVFNVYQEAGDSHNLYYLNTHPNQEVEVDPLLYSALAAMEREPWVLTLGPAYEQYEALFNCGSEDEADQFDPARSPEVSAFLEALMPYAGSEAHIRLRLLGENRVKLEVSDAYLRFAQQEQTDRFLDFFWTKNAFIADAIAETLRQAGFTRGYLSSYDGFARSLDSSGDKLSVNLFQQVKGNVVQAGRLSYTGTMSLVQLRPFRVNNREPLFFRRSDGSWVTPYLGTDGGQLPLENPIVVYSTTGTCQELLAEVLAGVPQQSWETGAAERIVIRGTEILCTDKNAEIDQVYSGEGVAFSVKMAG